MGVDRLSRLVWMLLLWSVSEFAASEAGDLRDVISHADGAADHYFTIAQMAMRQQVNLYLNDWSDGGSGIKRIRLTNTGVRSYQAASYVDLSSFGAMHEHADHINTLGFGEMVVVLNGIEFRSRHNDYTLKRRNNTKAGYDDYEDLPFPDVPPKVLGMTNRMAVGEMKQWFKAWMMQRPRLRNYKPYFRAALCYLEGAWTNASQDSIEDLFFSERHGFDVDSFSDLAQLVRFSAYAGVKDLRENLALLPSTLFTINPAVAQKYGQWNYAILCHPLKDDLPTKYLSVVDDVKVRMAKGGLTLEEYTKSRGAHFKLEAESEKDGQWTLLDSLMEQIPGRDGYGADITDDLFGVVAHHYKNNNKGPLNTGFYHRWYSVKKKGHSDRTILHRGLSDGNVFMAQTTDPRVMPIEAVHCTGKSCSRVSQRWTYAIPLEIVYMTPLHKWNPLNIVYRGLDSTMEGQAIFKDDKGRKTRNGSPRGNREFNGINSKQFYQTPFAFFKQRRRVTKPIDTSSTFKFVANRKENRQKVAASGFYYIMPNIGGIGRPRIRYPIMPVHGEESHLWKEIDALKSIILDSKRYNKIFVEDISQLCAK